MSNDNYNIDDILSEVKKRKEEEKHPHPAPEESAAEKTQEEPPAEAPKETEKTPETKEEAPAPVQEPAAESTQEDAPPTEKAEAELLKGNTGELSKEDTEMVNLLELAGEESAQEIIDSAKDAEAAQQEEIEKRRKKEKTKKAVTAVIAVLLVLILIAAGVFLVTANGWLDTILKNSQDEGSTASTTEWQGMNKLVENFDPIQETEATELSSLEDMVKTWYKNGSPCSSTHVLNILLIGEDTRGSEILEEGTRADSAIIASVNIDTGKITLTSILRDSWAYWETEFGNEETGTFGKLNGAMSMGSVNCYKHMVEQLYKIKLDGHAIVNFDSFETIIDALGGVELEITDAEINEVNNHQGRYGHVTIEKKFEGTKGKQKLSGKEALAYCRIRHIDTDNARADRQKTCLIEVFNQAKGASTTKLLKFTKRLIPYIKTSFGKNDIIKIATYAFSKGWLDYDTEMTNLPEMNLVGGIFKPDFGGQWIWRADFPADAYNLQMRIYGKSSITLAHLRVDTKTVRQSGFYQDGARPTDDTVENEHYGEQSTLPPTTEEGEESEEESEA